MFESLHPPGKSLHVPALVLTVLTIVLPHSSPAQFVSTGEDAGPGRFSVDSESSWLHVLVYRGGLFRSLGHNHVVSHKGISGTIMIGQDPLQSELLLEFPLADLAVDEAELRTLEGADFPGQISQKNISGTRANMLGKKLLQADQFPYLRIRSRLITGSMPDLEVEASVTVRGAEFIVVFPVRVELTSNSFVAGGQLEITHSDIGLKPFKAALGTLRVRDTLVLKYQISGKRSIASE